MNVYLDSSVILRVVLGQKDALAEWKQIQRSVVSALVPVECLRTLDRARIDQWLSDEEVVRRREAVFRILASTDIVQVTETVLARAAHPLPVKAGTLDAIHLATTLLWREVEGEDLAMATHDRGLALAARASALAVIGCSA